MTLHEAIVRVLQEAGHAMTVEEIADRLNQTGWYVKRDGSRITPYQIHGRCRQYSHLFGRIPPPYGSTVYVRTAETAEGRKNEACLVGSRNWLIAKGFRPVRTVAALQAEGVPDSPESGSCGVYALVRPECSPPEFIAPEEAKEVGNVIRPWSVSRLREKWVDGAQLLYIGVAGRKNPRALRLRLRNLVRHSLGKTSSNGPHKGGEILWQVKGWPEFEVVVLPTDDPPVPRESEVALIDEFRQALEVLPFANRQR